MQRSKIVLLPKTLDYYLTSTPPSDFQTFLRAWSGGAVRSPQGHRCCGLQWLRMQKNPLSTNAWLAGILWKLLNFSRFVTFLPSDFEVSIVWGDQERKSIYIVNKLSNLNPYLAHICKVEFHVGNFPTFLSTPIPEFHEFLPSMNFKRLPILI